MKTYTHVQGFLALTALAATLLIAGTGSALADNGHHYPHASDHNGYWDGHHYRPYTTYHNHRGYWGDHNGVRIWINI